MTSLKHELEKALEAKWQELVEDWKELLRFESVSTDPAYHDRCLACAAWLLNYLSKMGFESRLLETDGKPVVYAEYQVDPAKPVVLFYAHYDVQPADPLELWNSPPFEPEVRDGKMYGRGAVDDKGQLMFALKAFEILIKEGKLDYNLRLFIEGEEECGSSGMAQAMSTWPELKGDILMVCDTGMVPSEAPTITMGLRGIVDLSFELRGPLADLHSGTHGGLAPNPATGLAHLISSFHDKEGKVAVEGFYDGVPELDSKTRELANLVPFDSKWYEGLIGCSDKGGEFSYSAWERAGLRPTLEINGLQSGYNGPGVKTIIPSKSLAKLSARLVVGQDPQAVLDAIVAHLEKHVPAGLKLEITEKGVGGEALSLDPNSALVEQARAVLDQLTDQKTAFRWEGGSIPIVAELSKLSGAEPLLVGFATADDGLHAPNESFGLDRFKLGFLYVALFLANAKN